MRIVFAVAFLALSVVPAADAKLELSLFVSKSHPNVNEPMRAVVRAGNRIDGDCAMRLIAVAPGVSAFRAIDVFVSGGVGIQSATGYTFRRIRPTPRMGFEVKVTRTGPKTWRAMLRFPRVGRWRLVVPNECAPGYMYPWPAARFILVR